MKKIYIAGPYSKGDVAQNVKKAMDAADELIKLGFAPFCPHLTHFLHINAARPYETWINIDLVFLSCCDALIRLPGESNGADEEVAFAHKCNIPVASSIDELKKISF